MCSKPHLGTRPLQGSANNNRDEIRRKERKWGRLNKDEEEGGGSQGNAERVLEPRNRVTRQRRGGCAGGGTRCL
jgi:hypothetical protein